jgi:spermidine/putrescine transport system ATP-binding protein
MSDIVCIMRDGRVVQSGSPQSLYDDPVNRYVADFVGRSNFFPGHVMKRDGARVEIKAANGQLLSGRAPAAGLTLDRGDPAAVMIRPELISISAKAAGRDAGFDLKAKIKNRIFLGEHTEYLVETAGMGDILVLTPKKEEAGGGFLPGDTVVVGWTESAALVLADN